jgi:ADP-ribose pyrophosphatase YjhB (NUDIX family)
MKDTHFQYCPKLAVFDATGGKLLLCRRKGEQDYDGVFSLIGGKMEHKDPSIVDAIRREKNEEVGQHFTIRLLSTVSVNILFVKKDGNRMILPHYYAVHVRGDVTLSDEYSEFKWISLEDLPTFSPMVENVKWIAPLLQRMSIQARSDDFVEV